MKSRVAELHPHLDLANSPARRAASYSRIENQVGVLGNGFLEIRVNMQKYQEGARLVNKISGETYQIDFSPFEAVLDGRAVYSAQAQFRNLDAGGSADLATLTAGASYDEFDADIVYLLHRGDHYVQKSVVLHNIKRAITLRRVSLMHHHVGSAFQMFAHDGGMYFPVIFTRTDKGGLFFCADFPGYFVHLEGSSFRLDYHPGALLEPGRSFRTLTGNIGVYQLAGRLRANPFHESGAELDAGEQQWFREYLVRGTPARELPYIEMKGMEKGEEGPSDLEVIDECAWIGAKHVLIPRMLDAMDSYPLAEIVKKRLDTQGISPGLVWSRDKAESLRWSSAAPSSGAGFTDSGAFFAFDRFREFLVEHYLTVMERHGFKDVEVSGAPIVPYRSPNMQAENAEGEAPELLHKAFQGMADVVASLKENFGHVSGAGSYSCYGAGMAHLFDTTSFLVDDHPLPLPDIHVGRLFGDMNRLYFRRSHDFLLPKTFLWNSVGLAPEACVNAPYPGAEFYPWHLYHDSAGWRYSLISGIATGLRHRFHPMPPDINAEDRAFAQKWLKWEEEHVNDLKEVEEILDEPGLGTVDGYSYVSAHGATVFLFNTSYDSQTIHLHLRLTHDWDYVCREIYPRELNYLGPHEGLFRKDSEMTLTLEPKEARIIEAVRRSPAAARRKRAEIFGTEGQEVNEGILLRGRPGQRVDIGIRRQGQFRLESVRFPGRPVERQILDWVCTTRALEAGRRTLAQGAFPGKPCPGDMTETRNIWLCARFNLPREVADAADCSPFRLDRPCWTYPKRLFFVIRLGSELVFDPIRTSSEVPGIPENFLLSQGMKCGIDLAPANMHFKAWINGQESIVYPALAAWKRFSPNPYPVVAYFFEAGSKIRFGYRNNLVLFASHLDMSAFKGIYIEHLPELQMEKVVDLT
jgi:hypothetical protein